MVDLSQVVALIFPVFSVILTVVPQLPELIGLVVSVLVFFLVFVLGMLVAGYLVWGPEALAADRRPGSKA